MTEVKIVNAEALVVGPDQALVITVPVDTFPPSGDFLELFTEELGRIIGRDRVIVIVADDVNLAAVTMPVPEPVPEEPVFRGDHVEALGAIGDLLVAEVARLEQAKAEAEGGNLAEVYEGAIANVIKARDSVDGAIDTLAPEESS